MTILVLSVISVYTVVVKLMLNIKRESDALTKELEEL